MRACNSTFFGKNLYEGDEGRYCYLPESCEGLLELRPVQLLIPVDVHALEDTRERTDAHCPALLLEGKLELEVKFSHLHLDTNTVESHLFYFKFI